MEWKEGNERTARSLYQRALSVNSTNECAARCLQVKNIPQTKPGIVKVLDISRSKYTVSFDELVCHGFPR